MAKSTSVRNNTGLSNQEIIAVCPSVFASQKHESRSSKYAYVSSGELLTAFRKEGFVPTMAMQSGSRTEGKAEFTKHLLRLRKIDDLGNNKPDIHEIVMVNSHDGSSAYDLMSGVFRCVCTNGLITGDINNSYKVYHKGNITDDVIEATYTIIDEAEETMDAIARMKATQLTRPEQLLLSEFALKVKYDDEEKECVFTPDQMLRPRRYVDDARDVYTTFNVIQENLIKGGTSTRDKQYKRHTARAVNSIDGNVKINKMLWMLANRMMDLKGQ